jgi:hypothetical protein
MRVVNIIPWSYNAGMNPPIHWKGAECASVFVRRFSRTETFLGPLAQQPIRYINSLSVRYKMKIYVRIIRKLFFKISMLNQIDSPNGVLWIAKTRNQDWDAMKMHTLVAALLLCHAIQIVSAVHKKMQQNTCCIGYWF